MVCISCLGVSKGVHNIAFSLLPDSFYYYTWIRVLIYYKNTLYCVIEALMSSAPKTRLAHTPRGLG
jgi:hypothetical protein